jgi:hypothetical protein
MRFTSIKCYRQIKEEGLLSKRREEVWEALVEHGPCTAGELHNFMETKNQRTMSRNLVCSRLGELKDLNVAQELLEVADCKITGRSCLVWDVVDGLPADGPKRVKPSQRIKELETQITMLRARVEGLELENEKLRQNGQLSLSL